MSKATWSIFILSTALLSSGCADFFARFAANSTVRVINRASPAIQRYEDPDLAEEGMPASISTMEGLLVVIPENVDLRATLARSYGSLGFAFFEEHMEEAEARLDDEAAERWRHRASLAFKRGRQVATEMMTIWEPEDGGVDGHVRAGIESWTAYLQKFDAEQAPVLFWAAYNWARFIGVNRDNVDAVADLIFVSAIAARVMELDHTFYNHAPHALRGGLLSATPVQFGGQPAEGRQEIEIAIAATQRKNLLYLVMEARLMAIPLQDRALYRSLLEEVINAPNDIDPDQILSNQIAKRRAVRYLAQIDDFFDPEGTPADSGDAAAE